MAVVARDGIGRRPAARRASRLGVTAALLGLAGCGGGGGATTAATTTVPALGADPAATAPAPPDATATTATGGPGATTGPTSATPSPGSPATTGAPATPPPPAPVLRLGGNDLGVTRVGAPFREGVAAISGSLGRPAADPAPDSACIGAQDETSWAGFRLASSDGKVSGWLSTGTNLATPAGVRVGSTIAALRQAHGAALQVRPAPEPDAVAVFVVTGAGLGGTLTGTTPTDTVTSISNGTCEAV